MRLLASLNVLVAALSAVALAAPAYQLQTPLMTKQPLRIPPGPFKHTVEPQPGPADSGPLVVKTKPSANDAEKATDSPTRPNVSRIGSPLPGKHAPAPSCWCATGTICCDTMEGLRCNYGLCGA